MHPLQRCLGLPACITDAAQFRPEFDKAFNRHIRVQWHPLRHIANPLPHFHRIVAHIESGQLNLDRHPVNIVQLVRGNAMLNQVLAQAKKTTIAVLAEFPGGEVSLDRPKIQQVLNNLALMQAAADNKALTLVQKATMWKTHSLKK